MRVERRQDGRVLITLSHGEARALVEGISDAWYQRALPSAVVRIARQLSDGAPPRPPRQEPPSW